MGDPIKEMENEERLDAINAERAAEGLAPLADIVEAASWQASKEGAAKAEDAGAEVKQAEVVPGDTQVYAAPEAVKPGAQSSDSADKARIAELERKLQLASTEEGRVAKLDRLLKESEARLAAAEARAAEAERKAQEAAEKAAEGDVLAGLTEEQKSLLGNDPKAVAEVIAMLTKRFAGKPVQPDLSELEVIKQKLTAAEQAAQAQAQAALQSRVNDMWAEVQKSVPSEVYSKFAGNAKWAEWYVQTYGGIANGDLYYNAVNTADADAVVDLFNRFMRYAKIEVPAKGKQPPLRADTSNGGPIVDTRGDGQTKFYADEVKKIEDDWLFRKRLPAGWDVVKFNKWSDEVDQALFEGRVLDRATGKPVREY